MRILLFSPTNVAFTVATPEHQTLGGISSCVAYLARALKARGHDVSVVAMLPDGTPPTVMGIEHLPLMPVFSDTAGFFRKGEYDAVIATNFPNIAMHVKNGSPRTFNVAWLHIYPDQPALEHLVPNQPWLDAAVCVSETLRKSFRLTIPTHVIGNAVAPFFENMFASPEELLAAKQNRAVYASMPFRGLDLLLRVMGQVKGKVEVDIYSSMKAYQAPEGECAMLYDLARRLPRVRYHGGVGQSALAEAFRGAAYLAYPSTFIESYCIVAQEAIAAGLKVISHDMGALAETTMGFADLVPIPIGTTTAEQLVAAFTKLLEKNEADFTRRPKSWAQARFEQMQRINRECTWSHRAAQWEEFLAPRVAERRR